MPQHRCRAHCELARAANAPRVPEKRTRKILFPRQQPTTPTPAHTARCHPVSTAAAILNGDHRRLRRHLCPWPARILLFGFTQGAHSHSTTIRVYVAGEGQSGAPIRASAGKHLVDAEHVPRVNADAKVERILAGVLHHVLVARHAGGLKRLGRDLLLLHRHHVGGEGEVIDRVLLLASVVDADLRVCGRAQAPEPFANPLQARRATGRARAQAALQRRRSPGTPRLKRDLGYGLFF